MSGYTGSTLIRTLRSGRSCAKARSENGAKLTAAISKAGRKMAALHNNLCGLFKQESPSEKNVHLHRGCQSRMIPVARVALVFAITCGHSIGARYAGDSSSVSQPRRSVSKRTVRSKTRVDNLHWFINGFFT